jgi:hypothetical protein
MLKHFTQIRHAWLIALMVFVLGGLQIVQASPLHDHSQHTVDGGLCHVPLGDGALPTVLPGSIPVFQNFPRFYLVVLAPSQGNPSPYQGRAPPRITR